MGQCRICGQSNDTIADILSLCSGCIRSADEHLMGKIDLIHQRERRHFGLPMQPPDTPGGVVCRICHNQCLIGEHEIGYCGIRANSAGKLFGGNARGAAVSWYHDPLPTNCVADWVCPGSSGSGYPRWAHRKGPEYGYTNLAVFYEACTFDCLFCQNWHFREESHRARRHSSKKLAGAVLPNTACICFFGGDPTAQLPHAIAAAESVLEQDPDRIIRVCWETNGSMDPALLDKMLDLSLASGGCVKFDLKAFDPKIHRALCGVNNTRTLDNFAAAAKRIKERTEPPLLIASTLLVPGYIDEKEVKAIASFIADLDPSIPYSLLGFYGSFLMADLPTTSRAQAQRCASAAKSAGLTRLKIGNIHLLDPEPEN